MTTTLAPSLIPEHLAAPVPLKRGRSSAGMRAMRFPGLRAPLLVKVVGANLVVVAGLTAVWKVATGTPIGLRVGLALLALLALHFALIVVALRPIRDLESA